MASELKVVRVERNVAAIDLTEEREELKKVGVELVGIDAASEEAVIAAAGDADAIITGAVQITRRVMASLPRLEVVVRYGIGYEGVSRVRKLAWMPGIGYLRNESFYKWESQ